MITVGGVAGAGAAGAATTPTTHARRNRLERQERLEAPPRRKPSKAKLAPGVGSVPSKPAPPSVLKNLHTKSSGESYEQKSKNLPNVVETGDERPGPTELERRREELAGRVAELHWDLGGLAYEMAIRDHFRNDVLLRRAAQLQELDTELAEVERKLGDARAQEEGPGGARSAWARVLPPAQICALLLVAFLGFGARRGRGREGLRARRPRARRCWSPRRRPPRRHAGARHGESLAAGREGGSDAERRPRKPKPRKPGRGICSECAHDADHESHLRCSRLLGRSRRAPPARDRAPRAAEKAPRGSATKLPAVKHVFVVMLDDEPYATVFGPASPAHYLTGTLETRASCSSATTRSRTSSWRTGSRCSAARDRRRRPRRTARPMKT